MIKFLKFLTIIFVAIYVQGCVFSDKDTPTQPVWSWEPVYNPEHTKFGIPIDSDSTDDYLIHRYGYTISYNPNLYVANWVAWQLNKSWLGYTSRYSGDFMQDIALPPDFIRISHDFYTRTGFDRGHIVPSNDRTLTSHLNQETFFTTNIYPQTPDMNQGVWASFETYLNNLADYQNKDIYIVSGAIFSSGRKIKDLVAIPDTCYKIAVILEMGQSIADVDSNTNIISVKIPNIDGIRNEDWQNFKCSIDDIERSVNYDFLNLISDSLEIFLESNVF